MRREGESARWMRREGESGRWVRREGENCKVGEEGG